MYLDKPAVKIKIEPKQKAEKSQNKCVILDNRQKSNSRIPSEGKKRCSVKPRMFYLVLYVQTIYRKIKLVAMPILLVVRINLLSLQ
jgi:hypothetical protein